MIVEYDAFHSGLLVNVDLTPFYVPLRRIEVSIGKHGRVQFLKVNTEFRSLVVVDHGKMAYNIVSTRAFVED